jgi:hypothetical protein
VTAMRHRYWLILGFASLLFSYVFHHCVLNVQTKLKLSSVALVRERNMSTERPPLVGKVSANFCG